ncbi:MAG: cation:proton antiporter [Bdellovibrionales bacterium]|nr:cation:proton antiporter [Bdellovibrionales bacterium]
MEIIIVGLAALFFLGHALSWFFMKTKVPDLLILTILGFVAGPYGLGWINASDFGEVGPVLSTVALIVILYEGGLHLSMQDLIRSSSSALILSLLSFASIVAVATFVLKPFLPFNLALLTGVGIGSTSSAIVIPMVKFLSINKNTKTVLSLESAFTDVLTIIIFLSVLDSIHSKQYDVTQFVLGLGSTPLISVGIGIGAGLLWAMVKKFWKNVDQLSFSGEAWSLLTYGATEFLQFNGAISVLALGFTLSNVNLLPSAFRHIFSTEVSQKELSLLSTITFLLRTFFFIYLGLLIQFTSISMFLIALLLCALIFVTRYVTARLILRRSLYPRLDAMTVVAMGPRGLACAVLATLPLQKGIEGGDFIQNLIFSIIPLSILFTSIFVSLSEKEGFRSKLSSLFKKYDEQSASPPTEPSTLG